MQDDTQGSDNMSKSDQIDGEADKDFDFAVGTPDDDIPAWIHADLDCMAGFEPHIVHPMLERPEKDTNVSTHTPKTRKRQGKEYHRNDP